MFRRVLVGVDSTPLAEQLVTYAADFARAFDARLSLLHAYDWSERTAMAEAPTAAVLSDGQPKEEAEARSRLDHLARPLRAEGLTVDLVVLDDTAADAIVQESQREPETLVVLGAHDHGWLARLLRGDTSHDVMSRLVTPILIVPERT
ncbi:MAG: universal stress protein [Dehalococcoidia bacterium]